MRMLAEDVDGGWRISLADVERDGPYSRFAGMTRVSLVMQGAGVTLDEGTTRVELQPGRPSEYDGGTTWQATLRDGPVIKLNAMAARGRYHAHITLLYETTYVQAGCFVLVVTLCGSCIVSATDSGDAIVLDAAHVATRLADGPALEIAPSRDEDTGKVSNEAPTQAPAPYGALVIIEPVSRGWHAAHADSLPIRKACMKVMAAVKRVVDYNVKVRVKADQTGVDIGNVKMSMNPFDEIAIEAATRLKEASHASDVIAVTCGPTQSAETLRTALAIGADRALHIQTDVELQPLAVAKLLKAAVEREQPQLVILGKQAIDDDAGQTGQLLAALLDWPQATFASAIEIQGNTVTVTREVDGGFEVIELDLPAIVTTDLRLNEPRYVTLPSIMKAKKKPLDILTPAELGVDPAPRLKTLKVVEPAARKAGVRVPDVATLIDKLRNEAKVI